MERFDLNTLKRGRGADSLECNDKFEWFDLILPRQVLKGFGGASYRYPTAVKKQIINDCKKHRLSPIKVARYLHIGKNSIYNWQLELEDKDGLI